MHACTGNHKRGVLTVSQKRLYPCRNKKPCPTATSREKIPFPHDARYYGVIMFCIIITTVLLFQCTVVQSSLTFVTMTFVEVRAQSGESNTGRSK